MLEQAAQRGCGYPIPGVVQDQVGRRPGQPILVSDPEVGGSACSRGLELGDPWGPFQPKPFYDPPQPLPAGRRVLALSVVLNGAVLRVAPGGYGAGDPAGQQHRSLTTRNPRAKGSKRCLSGLPMLTDGFQGQSGQPRKQ